MRQANQTNKLYQSLDIESGPSNVCVCIHFGLQLFEAYRSAVVCALEKGTNKHIICRWKISRRTVIEEYF